MENNHKQTGLLNEPINLAMNEAVFLIFILPILIGLSPLLLIGWISYKIKNNLF